MFPGRLLPWSTDWSRVGHLAREGPIRILPGKLEIGAEPGDISLSLGIWVITCKYQDCELQLFPIMWPGSKESCSAERKVKQEREAFGGSRDREETHLVSGP